MGRSADAAADIYWLKALGIDSITYAITDALVTLPNLLGAVVAIAQAIGPALQRARFATVFCTAAENRRRISWDLA